MILVSSVYPAVAHGSVRAGPVAFGRSSGVNQLLASAWSTWSSPSDPPPISANLSTRAEILGFISSNPGVYLRDMSEEMGLAIGDVQYHLWILVRDGEVVDRRDGRYRRFFESGSYSEVEQEVISALRRETAGRIVMALVDGQSASHLRLAAMLGVTSQAVTWQMKRLVSAGLAEVVCGSDGKSYRLSDATRQSLEHYLQRSRTSCYPTVATPRQREVSTETSAVPFHSGVRTCSF